MDFHSGQLYAIHHREPKRRLHTSFFLDARTFSMKAGDNEQRDLAAGEHFGRLIYYWFIGRELNRYVTLRVFGIIHIKAFCELRLDMLGWVLLNLSFCV